MNKKYVKPWNATTWFTRRPGYIMFMVRELTALFLAIYLVALLVILGKLSDAASFVTLLSDLTSPGWRILHAVALVATVWHAITWFNLTPKAMPVFIGENRAPGPLVAIGMGYAPWAVVSAFIVWLIVA